MHFKSFRNLTVMYHRNVLLVTFLFKKAAVRIDASSDTSPTTIVASERKVLRVFSQVNNMIYNITGILSLGMKHRTDNML